MRAHSGCKRRRCQLNHGEEALHQGMLCTLRNRVTIERDRYIISLHNNGSEEAKCKLFTVILGISFFDRVECLGDLFICSCVKVQATRRAKYDVVTEPERETR